jgi:hypothetical protein
MDLMQEHDDELNRKVILLSVGSAAAAAILVALARHRGDESATAREDIAARAEVVAADAKRESKKAAKAAKKKRKEIASAAAETGDRVADEVRDATERLDIKAKAAERDLKAAAWDAQQEAKEAESRLRAAGHRVVDDATHLAARFGAEARSLAGEGKEKIAQLRHRDEGEGTVEREMERLRGEVEELKAQLAKAGRKADKDALGLAARFSGRSGPIAEAVASEATAAALGQIERTLRAKAPALLAARNKAQVVEILQKELGSTLRDTAVQAAVAALGKLDWTRESGTAAQEAEDDAKRAANEARDSARRLSDDVADELEHAAEDARSAAEAAAHRAETIQANGKRRFWRSSHDADDAAPTAATTEETPTAKKDNDAEEEGAGVEHRGKAGLFWGGAGIGLALYALLDAERRDRVLQLANEASIQVQELVRDLQGYDDEF